MPPLAFHFSDSFPLLNIRAISLLYDSKAEDHAPPKRPLNTVKDLRHRNVPAVNPQSFSLDPLSSHKGDRTKPVHSPVVNSNGDASYIIDTTTVQMGERSVSLYCAMH